MRTFNDLELQDELLAAGADELGDRFIRMVGGPMGTYVRHLAPADVTPFAEVHEAAHLWIHRDYDHDLGRALGVDEPIERGVDYVVMPRRMGDSIAAILSEEDPAPRPPKYDQILTTVQVLKEAATHPVDRFLAELVHSRVSKRNYDALYVYALDMFRIEDLMLTRTELDAWKSFSYAEWLET